MKNMLEAKLAMMERATEMIERLKEKPEVLGILVHGGLSDNPRHETDWSSDLDLTIVTQPGYLPWHNFKHYEWLNDRWLEVDLYRFEVTNDSEWDVACREGYAYSTSLKFDRNAGKIQSWLDKHSELTPDYRLSCIKNRVSKAIRFYDEALREKSTIDRNIILAKVVKLLCEVVFFINWEYPPDVKWRVSGSSRLAWKPEDFATLLGKCYQTKALDLKLVAIRSLRSLIAKKLAEEGIIIVNYSEVSSPKTGIAQLARLFTRIDKYTDHSVAKCVRRGLPWNAHDLVNEGIENTIDIIYCINNVVTPSADKFAKISELKWKPKNYGQFIYQASTVSNYENADDALVRANALRQLFYKIRAKIEEMGVFATSSLYAKSFMNENIFGKDSPYMITYKNCGYLNRSQREETFAEMVIAKATSFSQEEKNILFGMCNHYLIGSKEEFVSLDKEKMCLPYVKVWEKAVKQL